VPFINDNYDILELGNIRSCRASKIRSDHVHPRMDVWCGVVCCATKKTVVINSRQVNTIIG